MRCPICGSERLALAAVPGEQPGAYHVCLECAAFWERPPDRDRPADREAAG